VLNVIRDLMLGPLHSHIFYHAPTNRSSITLAHILPRFARLPVRNTKNPRVKKTMQAIFVLGACLMLPCLVPLVLQSTRTIVEHIIKGKTAAQVMMLWKYKPLNQDDAL
jgi:hypothetical protein